MTAVALYLQNDRKARARTFKEAAEWFIEQQGGSESDMWPVYGNRDLLEPAKLYEHDEVHRLAIFAHGTPTAFGRPGRFGISTQTSPKYDTLEAFAEAWAPFLARDALVSLACCLCSRDPKWYRIQLFGKDLSPWGKQAYADGGSRSIAAKLCRAFERAAPRRGVEVRGHCAAGHTINQALLRSHMYSDSEGVGRSLFSLAGMNNTAPRRKRWQQVVKGELAARWLLGVTSENALVKEIQEKV